MAEALGDRVDSGVERAKGYFDLHAMKRRFGDPPLFGHSVEYFDDFMLSLAACFDLGDNVIAVSIYQYGLEQFKMIALLQWRSDALHQHYLVRASREEANKPSTNEPADIEDILELCKRRESACFTLTDGLLGKGESCLEAAGQDFRLAAVMERNLGSYAMLDRLVIECSKRANELLRRIRNQSVLVAERLDKKIWELATEEQYTRTPGA